ncbi:MAG: RrF2 family transcriptional regulator [Planctomycetaceae bacterium]
MISLTLEYALRAVVAIAQNGAVPCTAKQISETTEIPLPYLSKMMQGLVRAGIVQSQRGIHGGFLLDLAPAELSIWDIAEVVDPVRRIVHCPLKFRSHGTTLCPLHRRIDDALAGIEAVFRGTTVAELLAETGGENLFCESTDAPSKPKR